MDASANDTLGHALLRASMLVNGDKVDHPDVDTAEDLLQDLRRLTHENVKTNDKGLEYCTDCSEGEQGLYDNVCSESNHTDR